MKGQRSKWSVTDCFLLRASQFAMTFFLLRASQFAMTTLVRDCFAASCLPRNDGVGCLLLLITNSLTTNKLSSLRDFLLFTFHFSYLH
ncbi:MAG: hypothetical protein LBE13_13885 [Bacteroidales bacterium]|nr:hypothetical protein [Bacteroidales bacterium]